MSSDGTENPSNVATVSDTIDKPDVIQTVAPTRPTSLPYKPLPENIPKLEKHLLEQFQSSTFNKSAPFPAMSTPSAHIHLKPNPKPYARHAPIPVPHHSKEEVKKNLDEDVRRGIIKPVPIGTPVEWCCNMVVTAKKDGRPRRTIDLQHLNLQCIRETHHCQTPFQLASQVPANTKKTILDPVDGYHAVELDVASQPLTTFITEWGRYM